MALTKLPEVVLSALSVVERLVKIKKLTHHQEKWSEYERFIRIYEYELHGATETT